MGRTSGSLWELGSVVAYNSGTHTATVRTNSGRPLQDVPQIKATGGVYDHLEAGTNVVVCWNLGFPAILGCMDFGSQVQAAITPPSITGVEGYGDDDPTQATHGGMSYKPPTAPVDMGPGDWAQVGNQGNHVAVMAGGVTSMGAPTAVLRSFGTSGTLQAIARRLETTTDFGKWHVENEQGRTSFVLRAGSNQATQTGLDEQHWTIRLDLGATGDMLDFVITEPAGRTLFRLHAGGDGRVQIYGDGGVDVSSGGGGTRETRQDVAGGYARRVTGADSTHVQGSRETIVGGDVTNETGGDVTEVAGGAWSRVVAGDDAFSVGGDLLSVVTGNVTAKTGEMLSTTIGKDFHVQAQGKTSLETGKSLVMSAKDTVDIRGSKIRLGAGRHPLPKFDRFLRDLGEFLSHLVSAIGMLVPSNPFGLAIQLALMQKFIIFVAQEFPYESAKCSNE